MTNNNVVCFLLGNSQASEFYILTFQNTLFHLHRQVVVETSAYKIQTPGNYPEESILAQHSEHGESLKSRRIIIYVRYTKTGILRLNHKAKQLAAVQFTRKWPYATLFMFVWTICLTQTWNANQKYSDFGNILTAFRTDSDKWTMQWDTYNLMWGNTKRTFIYQVVQNTL